MAQSSNSSVDEAGLAERPTFYRGLGGQAKQKRFATDLSFNANFPVISEYVKGVVIPETYTITFEFKRDYKRPPIYRGVYKSTTGDGGIIYTNLEHFLFVNDDGEYKRISISTFPDIPVKAKIRVYNAFVQ